MNPEQLSTFVNRHSSFKLPPHRGVTLLPITSVKRRFVDGGAVAGAAGEEIFRHLALHRAARHGLDLVTILAREADAGDAFAARKDDAAAAVIPGGRLADVEFLTTSCSHGAGRLHGCFYPLQHGARFA